MKFSQNIDLKKHGVVQERKCMFQKATKKQCKLRLALMGVSGSGKTFTSLKIAKGIGGKIALIDTERRSASKYADRFSFDVAELTHPTIENYIKFVEEAKDYDVLIIDSLSHAWQELLEEIDRLARTEFQGNTFRAWSKGTPKQRKLVNTILSFPNHVIVTMRSKTDYVVSTNDKGKPVPHRVGTGVEQGKGIEYEFDMLIEMNQDHLGQVLKDRTGKFQDAIIEKPDEKVGKELKQWLEDGEEFIFENPRENKETQSEFIDVGQMQNFYIEQQKYELADQQVQEMLHKKDYSPTGRKNDIYKNKFIEAKKALKELAKESIENKNRLMEVK